MSRAALAEESPAVEITAEWPKDGPTKYVGIAGKKMTLHSSRTAQSRVLGRVQKYEMLDVIEVGPKWTKVLYNGKEGFLDATYVELVQPRDPFAGRMPGVSTHEALALVLEDTQFVPPGRKLPIKLKAGTYMSVARVGEKSVEFPYRRVEQYASLPKEKVSLQMLVPWEKAQPGDLIYAFSTYYPEDQTSLNVGRMHNIGVAADRLNGLVVRSGEEFSFNKVVGPYSDEGGYKLAPILSGDADYGYGGGTCQVCSTLYNIVLRVPFVVVERHWHSRQGAKYLPAGFDATVGNRSDMRFRNVLPYDVRLGYTYGDGVMTAILYRAE
jgi:hypothetical protein